MSLAGRPMVEWSLDALRACEPVCAIVIVAPPGYGRELEGDAREGGPTLRVLDGGATRAQSVANALAVVETELVAIHDAARPLLTSTLLEALVADLVANPEAAGVIAASPVTDTVKEVAGDPALVIERTLDRSRLWAAQTPQVFHAEALRRVALISDDAGGAETPTDEAMLVEAAGGKVLIHPCGPENIKVTTPLDLRLAKLLLAERFAG